MIDFDKPIEAVNVEGDVCPARIFARDRITPYGRMTYLGLALEDGMEVPFIMNPSKDFGWTFASDRMFEIRNVQNN